MVHSIASTLAVLRNQGAPAPKPEHLFHPQRKWRFDHAWPGQMVAWEIEGVTPEGGRHQTFTGYAADCNKYNEAQLLGWIVIRTTQTQVVSGQALAWLIRALCLDGKEAV